MCTTSRLGHCWYPATNERRSVQLDWIPNKPVPGTVHPVSWHALGTAEIYVVETNGDLFERLGQLTVAGATPALAASPDRVLLYASSSNDPLTRYLQGVYPTEDAAMAAAQAGENACPVDFLRAIGVLSC